MNIKRLSLAGLCCIVAAGAIAACGSDDDGDSSSQTASTPTVTATGTATVPPPEPAAPKPAPSSPAKPSVAPPPDGPTVTVPDLVGSSLADAQQTLADAGLTFTAEARSGDRTDLRADWEVCKTVPKAGKRAPGNSPITLIAAAPGGC